MRTDWLDVPSTVAVIVTVPDPYLFILMTLGAVALATVIVRFDAEFMIDRSSVRGKAPDDVYELTTVGDEIVGTLTIRFCAYVARIRPGDPPANSVRSAAAV